MSARRRPTAFVDTITAGGKVPEFAHAKPKGKAGMKGARTVAELRAAVDTAEKRRAADMKEIRGELKAIRGLLELRTPNELRAGLAVVGSAGPEIVSLERLMDVCGNDAPLLWMLHRRGYDLHSLRRRESETERELRLARERIAELENERAVTMRVLREMKA